MTGLVSVYHTLKPEFASIGLELFCEETYLVVADKKNATDAAIESLIEAKKFFPLFSNTNPDNCLIFTVTPFTLPDFFNPSDFFTFGNLTIQNYARLYPADYDKHFEKVKSEILKITHDLHGSALILGYGNGNDIPLEKLAKKFDEVTLVDYDHSAMSRSVAKLPESLRSKITMIKMDLTCLIDVVDKRIGSLDFSLPLERNTKKIAKFVAEIWKPENSPLYVPRFTKQYNFVTSSMLSSQLVGLLVDYRIENQMKAHYPTFTNIILHPQFDITYERLSTLIYRNHIGALYESTLQNGHVFYADHPTCTMINYRDGKLVQRDEIESFSVNKVEGLLCEIFTIQKILKWTWQTERNCVMKSEVEHKFTFDFFANVRAWHLYKNK